MFQAFRLRPLVAALPCLLGLAHAHAEIMEDIDVRREGANAVVAIHLNVPISLVRTTTSRGQDLTQAYFRVKPQLNAPAAYVPGERRVVEARGLPKLVIEDEPVKAAVPNDSNRRLVIAFGQAARFKVRAGRGERALEVVLEGLGASLVGDQHFARAIPAAINPGQNFVIALLRANTPNLHMDLPVPQALQQYQVFTARRLVQGKQVHEMDLGYFATLAEAEAALQQLKPRFPQAEIVRLQAQAQAEADTLTLKPASEVLTNEQLAQKLLDQGRRQVEQGQFDDALVTLNQALELPVAAATPDAHELLGQTLAAMGEVTRAEAEFTSYLKLYPDHPGVPRVRAALAALRPTDLKPSDALSLPARAEETTVSGSLSQYYYGGKISQSQRAERSVAGTPLPADAVKDLNQAALTNDAQKLLSTFADATWRTRNDQREMKFMVRDQFDYNLLSREQLRDKSRYRNRLTAAYFDYMGLDATRLRGRLGRQNGSLGSEGRFDGASGSFSFRPKWKLSGAMGSPVDGVADTNRYFVGTSIDADAITPNFGASAFVLQRMIDGQVDRRATGFDLRYFQGNSSLMGAVDADTIYRRLNRASLTGNFLTEGNTSVNVDLLRQALVPVALSQTLFFQYQTLQQGSMGAPRTINQLLSTYTMAQLRQFVRDNTSYLKTGGVSVSTPLSERWMVGADTRFTSTGVVAPNEANGFMQTPASGITRSLGFNLIGNNLYSERDTNVLNATVTRGMLGRSQQLSVNNQTPLGEAWQVEPNMHWVRVVSLDPSSRAVQSSTVAWGPGFRASFKPRPAVTLESTFSLDRTQVTSYATGTDDNTGLPTRTTTTSHSNLITYSLGYRYEY